MLAATVVGAKNPQATDQYSHLRRTQAEQLRLVDQHLLVRDSELGPAVITETISLRLERLERLGIGLLVSGVGTTRRKGYGHTVPGILRSLLDSRRAAQHDQVSQRDFLGTGSVEIGLNTFEDLEHLGQLLRLIGLPILLRRQANTCTVGSATLVRVAVGRG